MYIYIIYIDLYILYIFIYTPSMHAHPKGLGKIAWEKGGEAVTLRPVSKPKSLADNNAFVLHLIPPVCFKHNRAGSVESCASGYRLLLH
jgi:hypothetical protein